jgi:hypothetical protein
MSDRLGGSKVNKFLTKVPNRTRMITRLLQAAAGLMLLLAAITAVASRPPMRESATATPISTEHECTSVGQTAHTIAALDVEMAMQVTPEYQLMSRYPADSPQYRMLERKARLRVTAAAQYVARQEQYGTVLYLPSSEVQDITERVRWTMVTPALDFFPVAVISTTPFTGDEVPLAA